MHFVQRVTLNIFDVRTGKVLREFKGIPNDFATSGISSVVDVSWPVFRYFFHICCSLRKSTQVILWLTCYSEDSWPIPKKRCALTVVQGIPNGHWLLKGFSCLFFLSMN